MFDLWEAKAKGHKYIWNSKSVPNQRWGVRLYHDIHSNCVRSRDEKKIKTGVLPPGDYFQCEKCYPRHAVHSNDQADADWEKSLRKGNYQEV